jgi:CheY-like chemotaxis protein
MPPRILLADDSVTVQKVIELTFSDEGMEVVAVGDGWQAIEQIDAAPPDVVLADVSMPGRDGYDVAAHVKQTPSLAHIPVVLMTGAFEQLDEARAREVGCDGVLAKPFEPQMVITMVRELLAQRAGPAAAPGAGAPPETPAAPGPAAGYPFEPGTPAGKAPRTLDDFFDRIDEALATRPPAPVEAPAAESAPPARSREDNPAVARLDEAPPTGGAPDRAASLADAFSDLLADELGESALPASWGRAAPAPAPASPAAPALAVTDEMLDEVARRAVARLSDEVIRAEVARHVIEVAERLVREEIERLKPRT